MSSTTIDISKLDKADVLRVLYDGSQPLGLGFLHYTPTPMTPKEATDLLLDAVRTGGRIYFDYVKGRVMKVDLSGDELDPRLYDRDNGEGAAERAIKSLEQKATTP